MRTIKQTNRFKRDLKREAKGVYKHALQADFVGLLAQLAQDRALPLRFFDHALTGQWNGYRECHIKPDLLLIYRKSDDADTDSTTHPTLHLTRLGSHSELFR